MWFRGIHRRIDRKSQLNWKCSRRSKCVQNARQQPVAYTINIVFKIIQYLDCPSICVNLHVGEKTLGSLVIWQEKYMTPEETARREKYVSYYRRASLLDFLDSSFSRRTADLTPQNHACGFIYPLNARASSCAALNTGAAAGNRQRPSLMASAAS